MKNASLHVASTGNVNNRDFLLRKALDYRTSLCQPRKAQAVLRGDRLIRVDLRTAGLW